MNKLNVDAPSLRHPSKMELDIPIRSINLDRSCRLIVLIPEDMDSSHVTRRIWELANTTGSTVQLLGLCEDPMEEMALRRKLVTVSALIQDAKISVETKLEIGTNWLEAVKHNYQEGDSIVCIADQSVGIRRRPLSQILESTLKATVYIFSGIQTPKPRKSVISRMIVAWSGFAGIMIGFFIVQVKIIQVSKDGFQTLMLILLLIPEFWFIKIWNSLFS